MSLEWKEEAGGTSHILYDTETGKVIGRVNKILQAYYAFYNSAVLGEYISLEFAKKAIENPPTLTFKEPEQTYRI